LIDVYPLPEISSSAEPEMERRPPRRSCCHQGRFLATSVRKGPAPRAQNPFQTLRTPILLPYRGRVVPDEPETAVSACADRRRWCSSAANEAVIGAGTPSFFRDFNLTPDSALRLIWLRALGTDLYGAGDQERGCCLPLRRRCVRLDPPRRFWVGPAMLPVERSRSSIEIPKREPLTTDLFPESIQTSANFPPDGPITGI